MRMNVYGILDAAVQAFLPPFYARADGEATRMFAVSVQDGNKFAPFASHYSLFRLAIFDDSNGSFECEPSPVPIMTGIEAKLVKPE